MRFRNASQRDEKLNSLVLSATCFKAYFKPENPSKSFLSITKSQIDFFFFFFFYLVRRRRCCLLQSWAHFSSFCRLCCRFFVCRSPWRTILFWYFGMSDGDTRTSIKFAMLKYTELQKTFRYESSVSRARLRPCVYVSV